MPALQTRRRSMTPARRRRIFEARGGVCAFCEKLIEGPYEIDHLLPLVLGGADDDGGNTVPMHPECHRIKTFGRPRHRDGGDAKRIAKIRRMRRKRGRSQAGPRGSLADARPVRRPDGPADPRDGTERDAR